MYAAESQGAWGVMASLLLFCVTLRLSLTFHLMQCLVYKVRGLDSYFSSSSRLLLYITLYTQPLQNIGM